MFRAFQTMYGAAHAAGWILLFALLAQLASPPAQAADPQFVGILAELAKDDVAKRLGLSDEQRRKLNELINKREEEVVQLVLKIMDLPAADREKQLAPFRLESERQGLALLDDRQRAELQKTGDGGNAEKTAQPDVSLLGDPDVAEKLKLSAEQRAEIAKTLASRATALEKASSDASRLTAAMYYDRKLTALLQRLQPEQQAAWAELAGQKLAAGDQDPVASDDAPAPTTTKQPEPAPAEKQPVAAATTKQPEPAQPRTAVFPDPVRKGDGKLRFSFRYAPWKSVLEWFADQADLSLVADEVPVGTFNYNDNSRSYTPTEALDLINGQLLTKNFTLVLRGKQLTLINLENGPVPKILVPEVAIEDIDKKGDFELIRVLFPLKKLLPEDADAEITPLLGRHGELVVLAKSGQIHVTEVAGRMRTIRDVIMRIENPKPDASNSVQVLPLKYVTPEEVMAVVRPLLGFEEDSYILEDGSLQIAMNALGTQLIVTGSEEKVARLKEIVKVIDIPTVVDDAFGPPEQPQLEVHAIKGADPTMVLQVMQTLMAGLPDVRLAVDVEASKLIALARPTQQRTIVATLKQMEQEGRQIAVIQLRNIDLPSAVLMINKLFGADVDPRDGGATNAPKVDGDPLTGRMVVMGSTAQIDQIRDLLEKLDPRGSFDGNSSGGNLRLIPFSTGFEARNALGMAQELWTTVGSNTLRIVTPSQINQGLRGGGSVQERRRPSEGVQGGEFSDPVRDFPRISPPRTKPEAPLEKKPAETGPEKSGPAKPQAAVGEKTTRAENAPRGPFLFVQQVTPKMDEKKADTVQAKPAAPQRKSKPGAPIVATITSSGILIASEDLDALNRFERLLLSVTDPIGGIGPQYTVFYLKYANAVSVAEMLNEIFGGGGGGGGGSLLGSLAQGALGGGGDLLGGLLGLGGGGGSSLSGVSIVAESRLNALIVQATARDIDAIEQLLRVLDQKTGPEDVEVISKPRLIPILNTSAEEIKAAVEQVYHDRILAAGGSGAARQQPGAEQLIRLLSRGRGGGRGGSRNRADDPAQKMKLGIHTRTNSLIVIAPEPLYQEVALLVAQLDTATSESNQVIATYVLKRSNPETVQKALSAILGDSIQTSATTASSNNGRPSTSSGRPSQGGRQGQPFSDAMRDQFRRQIEEFRRQQGGGGRPSFGGGDRGGGRPNFGGGRGGGRSRGGGGR